MRRLDASPSLQAAFERQRFAVNAVRSAAEPAPATLRARIAEQAAAPAPGRRRARLASAVVAGATMAAAVLLAVLLTGRSAEPTVEQALEFGAKPPQAAAPSAQPDQPALLRQRGAGLPYPNWEPNFAWRATGVRTDELEGRTVTTVFYGKDGRRVSYSIAGGEPLASPQARTTVIEGTRFKSFRDDGVAVVTWLRRGRTCVLSSRTVGPRKLLELAAWTGKGAVTT